MKTKVKNQENIFNISMPYLLVAVPSLVLNNTLMENVEFPRLTKSNVNLLSFSPIVYRSWANSTRTGI